jgi:glycosyltransferase involved in cell wall biosynthesis
VRVLILSDSDVFAGTERHMLDLAVALRGHGVHVRLGCPSPGMLHDRGRAAGVDVVSIQKGAIIDVPAIRILRRLLASGAVDVVHAHNGRTALQATIAALLAGSGRVVMTQHFLEPSHTTRGGLKGLASKLGHQWINRRIDRFIAISGAVRDRMVARSDGTAQKTTVVHNGIADPGEAERQVTPANVRRQLSISDSTKLIVCASRLEREKDVAGLVAAMQLVHATCPSAVCVVAGEGSERPNLERQIAERGLTGAVQLVGFRSDVLALMRAADLFVLPSAIEGFGLVVVEAMALGRPVIAMNAGAPTEIIEHGVNGLLVTPGNPGALSHAISRLLNDEALRQRLGQAGRQRYEARFTSDRMAAETAQVYASLLRCEPRRTLRGRVTARELVKA